MTISGEFGVIVFHWNWWYIPFSDKPSSNIGKRKEPQRFIVEILDI
jgi:hypothetical protein